MIGNIIRHFRVRANMSQGDIEKSSGIKREYLSKIENNVLKNPTIDTIDKIACALGVPTWELLKARDEKNGNVKEEERNTALKDEVRRLDDLISLNHDKVKTASAAMITNINKRAGLLERIGA